MAQRELNILIKAKDEASKQLDNVSSSLGNLSESYNAKDFQKAGTVITGVGVGLGAILRQAGLTAARTETMGIALEAVAESTGTSIELLREQEDALKKQGITTQEARSTLTKFMQSQLDVADASKVARVAQDLAVISGENSSETTARLTQAIATMNPMLLREVGIVKNLDEVFGDYGRQIGKNSDELTDVERKQAMVNLIMEEGEKVAGTYDKAMETAGKQLGSLDRHIEEAMNNLGNAFLPVLALAIEKITELFKWFNSLSPSTQTFITHTLMLAAGFALVVGPLLLIIGFLPMLAVGFTILMGPVGLVIAIMAGLVAVGILVYKNWDVIKERAVSLFEAIRNVFTELGAFLVGVWENITNTISNAWDAITSFFEGAWQIIKNIFSFALAFIVGLVITAFDLLGIDIIAVFEIIGASIESAWAFISATFDRFLAIIQNAWGVVWGSIRDFLGPIWESIKTSVSSSFTWISNIFKEASQPLRDLWSNLWDSMGSQVVDIWEGIKNTVKSSINWIIDKINFFVRAANKIARAGNVIPGVSVPQIPEIPKLAKGGIVNKPTIAMIGEAGPEAVVPLNNKRNFGTSISITVNGDISGQDLIDKISEGIMGNLRNNTQLAV
jgi:phage-related protein